MTRVRETGRDKIDLNILYTVKRAIPEPMILALIRLFIDSFRMAECYKYTLEESGDRRGSTAAVRIISKTHSSTLLHVILHHSSTDT